MGDLLTLSASLTRERLHSIMTIVGVLALSICSATTSTVDYLIANNNKSWVASVA